ncbi:MAG: DUF4160 domain-containing protein, partial [Bacteroidales bacterium]|nr:DUF4160 domain-containing protein [Bacteroidales bacterium]
NYCNFQIIVEIKSGIVEGKLPKRALNLVLEWYEIHKEELIDNWNSLIETGEYNKITPLE